jgi:Phosphate-selective porin O and P
VRPLSLRRPYSPVVLLAAMAALVTPAPARAAKIPLGEGPATLNVGVLAQPWTQLSEDGAPSGGMGTDFFLRRIRLMVSGNVTERLSFYVATDQPFLGRDGDWNPAFFIQDAFISVKLTENPLFIDAGMMLAPFTHHSIQGATTLHTLDYHASLIHFPRNEGRIWRDAGVQVRGFVGPLHFRAGIFNGLEGTRADPTTTPPTPEVNPDDIPRVVAHARYNLLGTEGGFFLNGIYFEDQPRLSIGVGADYQPRSVLSAGEERDDFNVGMDLFLEYPLANDQGLVFQTNAFGYFQGKENPNSGFGLFGELGYRIGIIEPVFSVEYFNADVADTDFLAFRPGLNLWMMKHTFNLKGEVAVIRQQVPATPTAVADTTTSVVGTAQLQLFY